METQPNDLPKLSAPAHRALAAEGITSLRELASHEEKEIASLHGVGPKVVRMMKEALSEAGLAFAK